MRKEKLIPSNFTLTRYQIKDPKKFLTTGPCPLLLFIFEVLYYSITLIFVVFYDQGLIVQMFNCYYLNIIKNMKLHFYIYKGDE